MRTGRLAQAWPGWRGDLAAGLVGAPDPPAYAALWHRLGTCAACQADYEDLVPVVGWHALLTSPDPRNMRRLVPGTPFRALPAPRFARVPVRCRTRRWTAAAARLP